MAEQLDALRARLNTISNLNHANAVLGWDQQTYMPPGGTAARGAQMATLASLSHEMFVADETGELLKAAEEEVQNLPYDSDDASLVRVARRNYDDLRKVPASFVAEVSRHAAEAVPVWAQAREENDFSAFAPCLQKTIDFSRQLAEYLGYEDHIYDALFDQFEPGMKTSQVREIFARLREEQVPLAHRLAAAQQVSDAPVHQAFDEAKQEAFGKEVVSAYGYDFSRGRLDRTIHPFATSFSPNDVRITTRYDPNWLNPALFGTMHESGHGMYEQGIAQELEGTPLADAASLGFHESQSRLWENVVGRGRPFWSHFYPRLQEVFPEQLGTVDLDDFYRAINKVEPSLIRVEADEVTYNLHIMLRFEMELALLEGSLSVEDAPEMWNQKMEEYVGIRPPTDREGILQDIHWTHGMMGYFPTYTLGNILSAQLYDAALKAIPEIPEQIARGDFSGLHGWLAENVYRHGAKFKPNELIERVTGGPMDPGPYLAYLKAKFAEVYGLET